MIPEQPRLYRTYGDVFRTGDYYRLASFAENGEFDVMMAVHKDRRRAVMVYVQVLSRERRAVQVVYPLGLDEAAMYRSSETGEVRSGAGWMYGGMALPRMQGDFLGKWIVLEAVEG